MQAQETPQCLFLWSLFLHVRDVLERLCAFLLLMFGQDVQLSMAAV